MIRLFSRLGAVGLLAATVAAPLAADDFEITFGDGGDCAALGGLWSQGDQTCLLQGLTVAEADQLLIAANANLIGRTRIFGTLESSFELTVNGTFENAGLTRNSGTMRVTNQLNNEASGDLDNRPGAGLIVSPGAVLRNDGTLLNAGLMFLQVQGSTDAFGTLLNRSIFINQGSLFGNATQSQSGGLLDNRATITNLGTLSNATIENRGEINGGQVEDDGPAKSYLINHASGSINGSSLSGLAFNNFGDMNAVSLGSGTLVNEPGGAIRVTGGQSYLMFNSGLFEVLAPFETLNNFLNQAGGVFLNRSTVTNRANWNNHGLLENRGVWINAADVIGQGILDNHGTLINADEMTSCLEEPDIEQLNNFGVVSNGGRIAGCGSTNSGSWYECGQGETPAGSAVIAAVDADMDGVCSAVDCSDGDPDAWAAPGELRRITVRRSPSGVNRIEWSAAAYLGGNAVLYDLTAFDDAAIPSAGLTCLSAGQTGLILLEDSPVAPGAVQFLIPRAVGCAVGAAGVGSDGIPRSIVPCP